MKRMYLTARFVLSPVLNFVSIDERPVPILNEVNLVVFLENKGCLIEAVCRIKFQS